MAVFTGNKRYFLVDLECLQSVSSFYHRCASNLKVTGKEGQWAALSAILLIHYEIALAGPGRGQK